MFVNDEAIQQIVKALESADTFLGALAAGDGFDAEAYGHFMEEMEACRAEIAILPKELRIICLGSLEIPMLMRNSKAIVAPADREKFTNAIVDVEELFCSLFSAKSND